MVIKRISVLVTALSILILGIFAGCLGDEDSGSDDQKDDIIDYIEDGNTKIEFYDHIEEMNNGFAYELFSQLSNENDGDNIFFSPWSVSVAMGMTYEGARGNTATQMEEVLHIPPDNATRWNEFKALQTELNSPSNSYELHDANAYWADDSLDFRQEYFDILQDYYQAEATTLDLNGDHQGSADAINAWVEEETNEKIKDLVAPTDFDANTALVLTNAIYFKSDWKYQFESDDTTDMDFYTSDDDSVSAPMMRMTGSEETFNYYENDDLQALELPYSGDELSMVILLPKENDISKLDQYLSVDKVDDIKKEMSSSQVDIYLPKFKFEQKYRLETTLADMGMPDAFEGGGVADFSGMDDGKYGLWIDQINHKAFVNVNEEGTEAAAATAVVVTFESAPEPGTVFKADHPFTFLIQQKDSGNILFMGRVMDPTAK